MSLVEAARALQPTLTERLREADQLRRVPDATIADFQAAGFFRMLQPSRWGGLVVAVAAVATAVAVLRLQGLWAAGGV